MVKGMLIAFIRCRLVANGGNFDLVWGEDRWSDLAPLHGKDENEVQRLQALARKRMVDAQVSKATAAILPAATEAGGAVVGIDNGGSADGFVDVEGDQLPPQELEVIPSVDSDATKTAAGLSEFGQLLPANRAYAENATNWIHSRPDMAFDSALLPMLGYGLQRRPGGCTLSQAQS